MNNKTEKICIIDTYLREQEQIIKDKVKIIFSMFLYSLNVVQIVQLLLLQNSLYSHMWDASIVAIFQILYYLFQCDWRPYSSKKQIYQCLKFFSGKRQKTLSKTDFASICYEFYFNIIYIYDVSRNIIEFDDRLTAKTE